MSRVDQPARPARARPDRRTSARSRGWAGRRVRQSTTARATPTGTSGTRKSSGQAQPDRPADHAAGDAARPRPTSTPGRARPRRRRTAPWALVGRVPRPSGLGLGLGDAADQGRHQQRRPRRTAPQRRSAAQSGRSRADLTGRQRGLAGVAHRRQRRRQPGEHRGTAARPGGRAGRARRRAPGRRPRPPAASATGRRPTSNTTGHVAHSARAARRPGPRPGPSRPRTSPVDRRVGERARPAPSGGRVGLDQRPRCAAARSGERTSSRTSRAPSPAHRQRRRGRGGAAAEDRRPTRPGRRTAPAARPPRRARRCCRRAPRRRRAPACWPRPPHGRCRRPGRRAPSPPASAAWSATGRATTRRARPGTPRSPPDATRWAS